DTCSLLVTIQDGRATRLRGDPNHAVTQGFLCAKVARYLEKEYHPDRLLYPLRRIGAKGDGRFERITWDQALDTIATRLQAVSDEYGPEAILPYSYAGTMGVLNSSGMDRRFFHRLGASRLDRTICSAAGTVALNDVLGTRLGTEPEQFRHARLIIAWGANIHGTNVHLWPFIVEARRQGAKFYTIDPVYTKTARLADRNFALYPGSDAALAFGLMHVIIGESLYDNDYVTSHTDGFDSLREHVKSYPPDRVAALTGLAKEDIVALAREYATTRPAVIRLNYGVQRSERGALSVRAVAMLPALTGAWKDIGGGFHLSTSAALAFDREALERPDLQPHPTRLVNMSQLGHALNHLGHPPVKALVVYNSNPAAIAPHQNQVLEGLRRPDLFTVVLEHFLTGTAAHADIVLPATTFLEHTDLYLAYGHYHLQLARPAVDPPGETKSNVEIFRLLAHRLGFTNPCFDDTEDDMIRAALGSGHPNLAGITLENLSRERSVRLRVSEEGTPYQPFKDGNFGSASGKCRLSCEGLDYQPPVESRLGSTGLLALYPLELISSKNDDSTNSTFGFRPEVDEQTSVLHLHSGDAEARSIRDGDMVRIFNDRGSLVLRAAVNGTVRPGVVRAPSVRWGPNANALTSDRLTDAGGGPTFYSCLVQVQKCVD
ncbi:MAG: molybdopterin-dependent oxidoreductase, partial [Acidobacteria bacterium]|nr:molybdopterin-dependent oxidoreductase [Acidobacteriota bacterium]